MLQNKNLLISLIILFPTIIQTASHLSRTQQTLLTDQLSDEITSLEQRLRQFDPAHQAQAQSSRISNASDDQELETRRRSISPKLVEAIDAERLRFARENADLKLQAKKAELDLAAIPQLKTQIQTLQTELNETQQTTQQKLAAAKNEYTKLVESVDATVDARLNEAIKNTEIVKKHVTEATSKIREEEEAKTRKNIWLKYTTGALAGFGIAKAWEHGLPQRALSFTVSKSAQGILWALGRTPTQPKL